MNTGQLVAFGVVAVCLGLLWRQVGFALWPLEGAGKVAFVIGAVWAGLGFLIGAHAVPQPLPLYLIGAVLLLAGILVGLPPVLRWKRERVYWKLMGQPDTAPHRKVPAEREERAA